MASTIQVLAEKLIPAKGWDYQVAWIALINHLRELNDNEFATEIQGVTNPHIFGYLWASGLSKDRQTIVRAKWAELKK